MTKVEFRDTIGRLDLSPGGVAALAGVSLRAVYRYLDGSRRVPPSVVSYLRLYEGLDADGRAVERARVAAN